MEAADPARDVCQTQETENYFFCFQVSTEYSYITIALDHITALLTATSAVVDLHAAVINRQPATNFKVLLKIYNSATSVSMISSWRLPT